VVVFPAPLVPRNPKISPRRTSKSMLFTASWVPYTLRNPWTVTAAASLTCGTLGRAAPGPADPPGARERNRRVGTCRPFDHVDE